MVRNWNKLYIPYGMLAMLFIVNLWIFWPGQMTSDSHGQYQAAIANVYDDHHPPMMSFIWSIFNKLHTGSGLMLLLHLIMLYGAAAVFMMCIPNNFRWLYILLPLIPPISFYSSMIWKDVGFAFAYLLATALISYNLVRNQKPSPGNLIVILSLLFYGTAVKFQGMYVLPIALLGLCSCYTKCMIRLSTGVCTIVSYSIFMTIITAFNNYFVPPENKHHSWQLVKLYDLAALSVWNNDELFPKYITSYKQYSFDSVKSKFNHERVDDLVFFTDSPLPRAQNEAERHIVFNAWKQGIYKYPLSYIKHRFKNWWRMVNIMPIERLDTLDFSLYVGLQWFTKLQRTSQLPLQSSNNAYESLMIILSKFLFGLFEIIRHALRTSFLLPFLIAYFVLGIIRYGKHPSSIPLIMLTGIGYTLLIAMFFFSMASSIRYLYIVICMIHSCHAFAFWNCKDWITMKGE